MDLNNALFFEKKLITFINQLLHDKFKPTPLTDLERNLLKKSTEIIELDSELNGNLVQKLTLYQKAIPPYEALKGLVYANRKDMLNTCVLILDYTIDNKKELSFKNLKTALDEASFLPPSVITSIYGEYSDGRIIEEPDYTKEQSYLNLENFKNFK